ncbi:hypothetical protein ANN_06603 [Periplaneta americana]|uniref:Uncharacterized protein n=1 Tax=Periplaneta americana TaxID=6978 RepID=A0ABQ8TE01_PERAM|nr:hypothetical protein ANN_06603 [Periplaneta americana]
MIDLIFNFKDELSGLFKSMMKDCDEWDSETRACAADYYWSLQSFNFEFLLEVFSAVPPKAEILFGILQKKIYDVGCCKQKTGDFVGDLINVRDSFDTIWSKMERSCENLEMRT